VYAAVSTGELLAGREQEAIGLTCLGVDVTATVVSRAARLGALGSCGNGKKDEENGSQQPSELCFHVIPPVGL